MNALPKPGTMAILDPYRRITSSGRLIPEIDGLRFVAILSVFIYHLTGDILRHTPVANQSVIQSSLLFPTTQVLNIGVQLFFVISGFILGMPFAASYRNGRGMVPLPRYFKRRVTQLEVPYILTLLAFFQLKTLSGKGTTSGLLPHLMASVFYVHNLLFKVPSAINFVAWSLEVEVQFYIVAPTLALIFRLQSRSLRSSIFVILILFFTASQQTGRTTRSCSCRFWVPVNTL